MTIQLIYTKQVILIDNVKEEEDSIDVVHAALSAIIGDDPTEEQKLSPKVTLHKIYTSNIMIQNRSLTVLH